MSRETVRDDEGVRLLGVATVAGLVAGLTRPLAGAVLGGVGTVPVEFHHAADSLAAISTGLHLVYSVAFGGVFVAAVAWGTPGGLRGRPGRVVALGTGYGVGLWVVNVAVGWPLVQRALGLGGHAIPHLHAGPLVVHALYGLVLGAAVAALTR